MTATITNETTVLLNRKFNATINTKRKEALKICVSIKEFFKEELNITLPRYKNGVFEYKKIYQDKKPVAQYESSFRVETQTELDYIFEDSSRKRNRLGIITAVLSDNETLVRDTPISKNVNHHEFWNYDTYGSALYDAYGDLARMYYNLIQCSIKLEAMFKDHSKFDKNAYETTLACCVYSKHRLDPIWNFRKSRLIRKKYTEYLKETQLHKQFTPVHLTLTVPHKNGLWNGKRYYSSELTEAFNLLRKTATWKKYIYAGEYGVEVKPSQHHGLHIHIHSLCFQYPQYSIQSVQESLEKEWKRLMNNQTGYSGMHYEGLYFFKKVEGSRDFEKELKWKKDRTTGEFVEKVVKKKYYLDKNSSDEDMIHGIMECIKYHFKHDIFAQDNSQYNGYDIKFMAEVCRETRSKRLYSRFGEFYKETRLNFNNLESDGNNEEGHTMTFEDYLEADGIDTSMTYDPNVFTDEQVQAMYEEEERMIAIANAFDEKAYEAHLRSQLHEGVMCEKELRIINPFTAKPAMRLEYELILSFQNGGRRMSRTNQYKRDYSQSEQYYKLDMRKSLTDLWRLLMKGQIKHALAPAEQSNFDEKDMAYVPAFIQENY